MGNTYSTERTSDEYLVLNNCGIEVFYDVSDRCIREHGRVDYHILYIAEGICHLTVKNKTKKVPCGNIILFRPNEPQDYAFYAEDKAVSYYLHFTGVGCEHILKQLKIHNSRITYIGKNRHFEEVFDKLIREHTLKPHAYEWYCSALLTELFSIISRHAWLKKNNIGSRSEQIVEDACRKIYENPGTVSVSQLAAEAYLSIGHFSDIFKKITKTPPQQYINSVKLQKAKDMLINTDFPIGKIAVDSGFNDQNYFSRIFKKTTGMSPKEFRK